MKHYLFNYNDNYTGIRMELRLIGTLKAHDREEEVEVKKLTFCEYNFFI